MARKGWESLTPKYRQRLEKGGITKSDYEAGQSLSKARGHARTPEHPTVKVDKNRYPEYFSERQRLIRELEAKKARIFGDKPRWSEAKSASHIRQKPISNAMIRWALADENQEDAWLDAIREDAETYFFLFYH